MGFVGILPPNMVERSRSNSMQLAQARRFWRECSWRPPTRPLLIAFNSSLVVDEVLSMKRMAVAYFYCSYRSSESQKPVNILGSLIAQLSLKDPGALKEVVDCFTHRYTAGKSPSRLDERELCTLFKSVSQHLHEVTLIIDGLDECGSSIHLDRGELVRTLADLRYNTTGSMRLAIFSRDEGDIRAELTKFSSVSVAAQSSDIQRFVQAKAGSLRIKDKDLQAEIIKALIHGAKGMLVRSKLP
jgi:hypothetical protein